MLELDDSPLLWLAPETLVESGGAVTAWNGYQGTAINVAQGTAGNRPAYVSSEPELGGQACADFGANNRFFTETAASDKAATDATWIFAYYADQDSPTKESTLVTDNATSGYMYHTNTAPAGTDDGPGFYDGAHNSAPNGGGDVAQILAFVFDATAGTCTIWRNGAVLSAHLYDGTMYTNGASNVVTIGRAGTVNDFRGKLGEVIFIQSAISDVDLMTWKAYLSAKFNIAQVNQPTIIKQLCKQGKPEAIFLGDFGILEDVGVETWTDQSNHSYTIENTNDDEQGLLRSDGPNSRSYVRYDGVDDYHGGSWTGTTSPIVFDVVKPSRSDRSSACACRDGGSDWMLLDVFPGANSLRSFGGVDNITVSGVTLDDWNITRCEYVGAGSEFAVNNGTPSTGNATSSGPGLTLGSRSNGVTHNADCDVAACVMYNSIAPGGDPYAVLADYYDLP